MQIAIEPNTVYTFKLNSGEELIAKVLQAGGDFIIIEEPVSIAPTQQGMQMIPSVFNEKKKGDFKKNTRSIDINAENEDSVRMKYLEEKTGIKVPDKKIVLG